MKREIKFRAWDKAQNKMLSHEDLDRLDKGGVVHFMDIIKPENKDGLDVMQYTGLHDKNGKEIYDGDIVRSKSHSPSEYVIKFIQGGFCATNNECFPIDLSHFYPSVGTDLEIIGNVYESYELLNQ